MAELDSFALNIEGVRELVDSGLNKSNFNPEQGEGVIGDYVDEFELDMKDEDLLDLRKNWESKNAPYDAKMETRSKKNKTYVMGLQKADQSQDQTPIASNILFESLAVYIPQALAKNPEPVVYSDNTPDGKSESNDLKTMLQYHTVELELQRKLGVMVMHNSIYFLGVMKHGWDEKTQDITSEIRKPKNFILDKDGYINEFQEFVGEYLGEKIECTAGDLIEKYPKLKEYIIIKTDGKLGTPVIRTEWWTDDYMFVTFGDKVLEKHKNPYFNYDKTDEDGEEGVLKGQNHFSHPKRPYTFLSVFTMQEQPHDFTTLIEQNIKNQDRISERDLQIDRNLATNNNSMVVSGKSFNQETAHQAAKALQDGDPVLVPDGRVDEAIKRIPANDLPGGILDAQQSAKDALRGVFGVQGVTAQAPTDNTTAHGMVLNQEYDSTRIGGGVSKAIEATARNVFNFWTQLYYVFYDQPHYASVLGTGQAIEYVSLQLSDSERRFVVTVAPNSMAPKDELSEYQNAISLWGEGALDPINLFKKLNDPDPIQTARMVTLYKIDPMAYYQQFFPPEPGQVQPGQPQQGAPPQPGGGSGQPQPQSPLGQAAPLSTQAPLPKL